MQLPTNLDKWYQAKPRIVTNAEVGYFRILIFTNGVHVYVELWFGNYVTDSKFCVKVMADAKHYDEIRKIARWAIREGVTRSLSIFLSYLECPFTILECERI